VFEDGRIFRFGYYGNAKEESWFQLKGNIYINKDGYKRQRTEINGKHYTTSRIIYKAFHPEWDIENGIQNNSIDHINRNSLDNHISNLRTADMKLQSQNRNCVINAKGYSKHGNKYQARICIQGKDITLGTFTTALEARQCYLNAKHLGN
jgi:hypothetical protein